MRVYQSPVSMPSAIGGSSAGSAYCWGTGRSDPTVTDGRYPAGESSRKNHFDTANRQLEEIGLRPTGNYRLVGVYPVNFKHRSDISICVCTCRPPPQEPQATRELSRYAWLLLNNLPPRLGSNYRTMLRDFKYRRLGARVTSTRNIDREQLGGDSQEE